jgi:RHH-type proline utilization regulon transcriptional repressor/proline dehydrogenase/delta 1-pyrroline-5-carboxylate dehydrogenase
MLDLQIYRDFKNVPFISFASKEHWENQKKAVEDLVKARREKPVEIFPIVNGEKIVSNRMMESNAPQEKDWVLAKIHVASEADAERAIQSLDQYFDTWRSTSAEERAKILERAADILESRRMHYSAVLMLEVGKSWTEADADVAEGIDFLRYYAIQARHLFKHSEVYNKPEEKDLYFYEPRGVALTIGPWNFPLAIPCGMFVAALVTGNPVIMKPAEQSTWIAWEFFNVMLEAGMPKEAAVFIPGYGEEVGDYMVKHKKVSTIAFTGSRNVGLGIIRAAADTQPGQVHVKRVIAEMGGKNAIIVDSDADLDKAVTAIVKSAFGFAGQKCSACSRLIVVEPIYDRLMERLKVATADIVMGEGTDPNAFMGPVVDEESYKRLQSAIEDGKKTAKCLAQAKLPNNLPDGYYVTPTVFTDVAPQDRLRTAELFGPVLAVIKVSDFDAALKEAMNSEYALTGGVLSRSPKNLEKAYRQFRVGNLYFNRTCTGALVGRQPFGGAHMSGVGSKAGGPDYLLQFVVPRTVCIPQ